MNIYSLIHNLLHLRSMENWFQGYVATRLKNSFQKFFGCHHNLCDPYEMTISAMRTHSGVHIIHLTFLFLCVFDFQVFVLSFFVWFPYLVNVLGLWDWNVNTTLVLLDLLCFYYIHMIFHKVRYSLAGSRCSYDLKTNHMIQYNIIEPTYLM